MDLRDAGAPGGAISRPLMPTVICSGHCFELVERLADKLRQVSLARLAGPAFDRDLEDSDPRHGHLR